MGFEKKYIDDVREVCRLCLGTSELTSVFDERINKTQGNIIGIIEITTGVTIRSTDKVSHKLCNKCFTITIKMFKFRANSIVNDRELKALANVEMNERKSMNETVENLFRSYPGILLPPSITQCNISPSVSINKTEVVNWLEKFKNERRAEKRQRKEAREVKKLVESSVQNVIDFTSEKNISCLDLKTESSELLNNESLKPVSPTSQSRTPQVGPNLQDFKMVNENQQQLLHQNTVPDIELSMLNDSDKTCKRTSSVDFDSPKQKKIKANLDHPKDEDSVDSLVTIKYVSESLLICDICNGILYSARDLKKHKMTHLRCNLCRKVFKSMKERNQHREGGCSIKQIMNNLPIIPLKRCDDSHYLRTENAKVVGIQTDQHIESMIAGPNLLTEPEKQNQEVLPVKVESIISSPKSDVEPTPIMFISDDEDETNNLVLEKDNSINIKTEKQTSNKSTCNKTRVTDTTFEKVTDTPNNISSTKLPDMKYNGNTAPLKCSNSIIKPNIQIAGEDFIDMNLFDDDTVLLKNLLRKAKRSSKEAAAQTVTPCNADIKPSSTNNKLFELKNLRDYLKFYKIPINISYAQQYSVRYSNDPSPSLKRDRSWSELNTQKSTKEIPSKVPTLIQNNSSVPSTPMTMSATAGIPTQLPPLTNNTKKGIANKTAVRHTGAIHKPQLNTNVQCFPPTVSDSVVRNMQPRTPVLNCNSPIILNYNVRNDKSSDMSNNNITIQPISNHVSQTSATTSTLKRIITVVPPPNDYIVRAHSAYTNVKTPRVANRAFSARPTISFLPDGVMRSARVNMSNVPSSIVSARIVNNPGGMVNPAKVNIMPVPSSSTNTNMTTVPGTMPNETKVNITSPDKITAQIGADRPTISVANNMPPPTSSFIPHRPTLTKSIAIKISAPIKSHSPRQNFIMNSNSMSNSPSPIFKQTIRVKDMSELR